MARPQLLSSSEYASSGNESSYNVPKPPGTAVGDFIIIGLTHSNNSNNMTPPGGINAYEIYDDSPNGQVSFSSFCWVVQETDPASYTFLGTHSGRVSARCERIGSVEAGHEADPSAVLDFVTALSSGTTNSWRIDGGNPNTAETLGICFVGCNGGADPIVSTSTWNDVGSLQSGTACATGSFQKDLLDPPASSGDAFGTKDNSGRYYGYICGIKPESGAVPIDLDLGHIDATPTEHALGLTADANLGLGYIDATPTVRLLSLDALTAFDLESIDGIATVWPLEIDQPTPGIDLDMGHIDGRPTVHPLELLAPAALALEHIDARPVIYPITIDCLTAFQLESINAIATVYPFEITQPGVATELDFGAIDARATVHPMELQSTGTLLLQSIDARANVHAANITAIAEINLAKINALATVYPVTIDGQAGLNLESIDARAILYPINLAGPITERGESQIMKIIGPRSMIKILAKGDFIKILK